MIRVLVSVLAVVAVLLAVFLKQPLLYAAAAIMVLFVVIVWIRVLQRRHRKPFTPITTAPLAPEENLKSLGIMEIRPKAPTKKPAPEDDRAPSDETAEAPPSKAPSEPAKTPILEEPVDSATARSAPMAGPGAGLQEFVILPAASAPEAPTNGMEQPPAGSPDEAVLEPFLQALRAALGAHTVCLLKQEDVGLDYQVVARVGEDGAAFPGETFSARTPLLTANMTRHPVTIRRVAADDLPPGSLGYSAAPGAIRQVALAPAPRRTDPDTYFLLADTTQADLLDQSRPRILLAQFARLLGTLLDEPAPSPSASPSEPASAQPDTASTIRPRREIIAEEMERARAYDQLLALALVYLNQAEAIADTGEEAVAEAEHLLETRLRQTAANSRTVRFGELTYGVFYDGDLPEVEAWGAQIQDVLSRETGLLEGGVSIGIALLQERHQTPDALRADATEALREAYKTGTCTILQ